MKYNKLTLIKKRIDKSADNHFLSDWKCDCGNIKTIIHTRVITGYTKSCGCLARQTKPSLTHGYKGTKTYSSWCSAKHRCFSENSKDWPKYGGAGITMHKSWAKSFSQFLRDMGERPLGTTLDRIDRNGNYEPGNCRWATIKEQQINRNGTFVWFIDGKEFETADDAAKLFGVTIQTIRRWVLGFYDARRNTHTPPKNNCYRIERYSNERS